MSLNLSVIPGTNEEAYVISFEITDHEYFPYLSSLMAKIICSYCGGNIVHINEEKMKKDPSDKIPTIYHTYRCNKCGQITYNLPMAFQED